MVSKIGGHVMALSEALPKQALRKVAKGAFLLMLALMIVTYARTVSQSAPAQPEPLPPYIYS